jgi:hypothetical protein
MHSLNTCVHISVSVLTKKIIIFIESKYKFSHIIYEHKHSESKNAIVKSFKIKILLLKGLENRDRKI